MVKYEITGVRPPAFCLGYSLHAFSKAFTSTRRVTLCLKKKTTTTNAADTAIKLFTPPDQILLKYFIHYSSKSKVQFSNNIQVETLRSELIEQLVPTADVRWRDRYTA